MSIPNEIKRSYKTGAIYTKLIYINVAFFFAIFVLTFFFPVDIWLSVPGSFKALLFKPWSPITYMFVHGGFFHILSNILWLFWFGQIFMEYLNKKQLLGVYLIAGLFGAFLHLLVNKLTGNLSGLIGASAAVMGIVFAVAAYKPDRTLYLVFIGPVKLKYIALVAVVIDVMGILSQLKGITDGIGHFAHLGGALFGLWFGFEIKKGNDITAWLNSVLDFFVTFFKPRRNEMKVSYKNFVKTNPKNTNPHSDAVHNVEQSDDQEDLNRILDKISKSGYDSLSKEDKEYLFKRKK